MNTAHPYQPLHSSSLNESLLAQSVDAAISTPPQTPTKTPHTNQTSHFFSPTSTPRALFPQAHTAHHDVSQMHAILQLQSQMLVRDSERHNLSIPHTQQCSHISHK